MLLACVFRSFLGEAAHFSQRPPIASRLVVRLSRAKAPDRRPGQYACGNVLATSADSRHFVDAAAPAVALYQWVVEPDVCPAALFDEAWLSDDRLAEDLVKAVPTVGNLDVHEARRFLRQVRRHMGWRGAAIIGVDLKKDIATFWRCTTIGRVLQLRSISTFSLLSIGNSRRISRLVDSRTRRGGTKPSPPWRCIW
jgi:hypothetical protein